MVGSFFRNMEHTNVRRATLSKLLDIVGVEREGGGSDWYPS